MLEEENEYISAIINRFFINIILLIKNCIIPYFFILSIMYLVPFTILSLAMDIQYLFVQFIHQNLLLMSINSIYLSMAWCRMRHLLPRRQTVTHTALGTSG